MRKRVEVTTQAELDAATKAGHLIGCCAPVWEVDRRGNPVER